MKSQVIKQRKLSFLQYLKIHAYIFFFHARSLHKQDSSLPYVAYTPPPQYYPTMISRGAQSTSTVIKPVNSTTTATTTKEDEKLLLKMERERQSKARAESNAQFKEYLLRLPPLSYPSHYRVDCVSTLEETNQKLSQLLKNDTDKVFGVDLEWPPCFVKGQPENKVTLVQICSADTILLIQVARIQGGKN